MPHCRLLHGEQLVTPFCIASRALRLHLKARTDHGSIEPRENHMKTSTIVCAVLAGGMFSSAAVAQLSHFYDEWGRPRAEWQAQNQAHGRPGENEAQQQYDPRDQRWQRRGWDQRGFDHPRHAQRAYRPYAGPRSHGYHRGSYLPREYRQQRYYVNNWNAYPGLYAPPAGHQWVQVGSDFALMAITTGLIVSLLANG
jgi:Ni/Co efflux regulator RcnB